MSIRIEKSSEESGQKRPAPMVRRVSRGGLRAGRPTERYDKMVRADVGIGPYESPPQQK